MCYQESQKPWSAKSAKDAKRSSQNLFAHFASFADKKAFRP